MITEPATQKPWPLPSREHALENAAVCLRPLNIERDLQGLFEAASVQQNGRDIFRWFINFGPVEHIQTLRDYLETLLRRSAASAMRLGFTFEGIFRQHYVSRGENRDTA